MKKISRLLAILLTSGISISAMASGNNSLKITPKSKGNPVSPTPVNTTVSITITALSDQKSFKVSAINETGGLVTVNIYDSEGNTVYSEDINSKEINRTYKLGILPKSTYTLYISSSNFTTYKELTLN